CSSDLITVLQKLLILSLRVQEKYCHLRFRCTESYLTLKYYLRLTYHTQYSRVLLLLYVRSERYRGTILFHHLLKYISKHWNRNYSVLLGTFLHMLLGADIFLYKRM